MSGVDLDHLEACRQRTSRGCFPGIDAMLDIRFEHGCRNRVSCVEGQGAGPDNRPAAFRGRFQAAPARPGRIATGLAPGVGELDAGNRALCLNEPGDPGQRLDMLIFPDSHVAGRNASLGGDGRSLDHHEPHAADRPAAKVNQVEVIGKTVLRANTAHGRHHDPVAESNAANGQRG